MKSQYPRTLRVFLLGWMSGASWSFAAQPEFPVAPGSGGFLLDVAEVLPEADATKATEHLRKTEQLASGAPVRLVIVRSIADYKADPADGWTVLSFARALLHNWSLSDQGRGEVGSAPKAPPATGAEKAESRAPRAGGAAFAERGLLILISQTEERVAVATAPCWLSRATDLRNVVRVVAFYLERGEWDHAVLEGLASVERLIAGRSVKPPGSSLVVFAFVAFFLLVTASVVSYLRNGTSSVSYKVWSTAMSATAGVITFTLRRGVELSSGLSASDPSQEQRGRLTSGLW